MKPWEALVEIVRSFNAVRRPGHALAALTLALAAFVVSVAVAAIGSRGAVIALLGLLT